MTALADQITQRCTEARAVINDAWSVGDLSLAALLVSQVEVLALMAAGAQLLPDKEPAIHPTHKGLA
jgi:hypothetical protein